MQRKRLEASEKKAKHTIGVRFFQSSVFEARFDRVFHALKRDAYTWGAYVAFKKGKTKT